MSDWFSQRLQHCLDSLVLAERAHEDKKPEYTASVGIVEYRGRWLLGLSTANDDRRFKWCFPGGHIKRGESPKAAAEREIREETGISCKAVGEPFCLPSKPGIAFVHCKATSMTGLKPNSEFVVLGFFKPMELRKGLVLHTNVLRLIDRVTH